MISYLTGETIENVGFVEYVEPGEHIRSRGPDPKTLVRLDWEDDRAAAGVFECGPCLLDITQGHNEHSVVLDGEVLITESSGHQHHYRTGDCFILQQDDEYTWEVTTPRFRKSFFMVKPDS